MNIKKLNQKFDSCSCGKIHKCDIQNVVIEEKAIVGELNDEKSIAVVGRSAVIPKGTKVAKGEIVDGAI